MTIGVGVEGPSDREFWDKVLHKHFREWRFDVRNMKNRDKLIRQSPQLLNAFRDLHYRAGFILVDMDDDPCVTSIFNLFEHAVRRAAREDKGARFLHVCVAIKELESWYLADGQAICALVPGCQYEAPADTRRFAKGKLRNLVKSYQGKHVSFNEIAFAKAIAPKFNPQRALPRSASLRYFWEALRATMAN